MNELFYRAEDMKDSEVSEYFVKTEMDKETIVSLKSKSPILLIGSRGNGKSMLLRVTESELDNDFDADRILGVRISFKKAGFLRTEDKDYFRCWMMSKILFALKRKLRKKFGVGNIGIFGNYYNSNNSVTEEETLIEKLETLEAKLESISDRTDLENKVIQGLVWDVSELRTLREVDCFQALIEDLCEDLNINRIILFFDEACHNFIPYQQREFFTLFRDLRSPFLACKAAVYPGIVNYGTFQAFHDAVVIRIERDILDNNYITNMRKIIEKQIEPATYEKLERRGELLDALIYSSTGNPRLLLKSVNLATNGFNTEINKNNVSNVLKGFYRKDIWTEHTKISDLYKGLEPLINWGRGFIEDTVEIDTRQKNKDWLAKNRQTCFFAIHRNAPESVKKSIKILEYSGIVILHTEGTRVRTEIFDRYLLNLGVIVADESNPVEMIQQVMKNLSIKLYTDYGMSSQKYGDLNQINQISDMNGGEDIINKVLDYSIDKLDLTEYQKKCLHNAGLKKVRDILNNDESELMKLHYIGEVRARRIWNCAYNSSIEYISG
ncbi:MAG: DNA-directed RNA polymerase subunit alpha C-terminal domain-containing protein [Acetobacterium sp.]